MNTKDDKFILGGHEFTSRFILGSGKFLLDLVKACIEKADAQIITLALRRANEGGLATASEYFRGKKCKGSGPHRKTVKRTRMRRFRES